MFTIGCGVGVGAGVGVGVGADVVVVFLVGVVTGTELVTTGTVFCVVVSVVATYATVDAPPSDW